MKTAMIVGTGIALLSLSSLALAQEEDTDRRTGATAPEGAFEIVTGVGYSQGFGGISDARVAGLHDLGGAGLATQIGLGYRINPRFMVGVYTELDHYSLGDAPPSGSAISGMAAGVQMQYHFMPFNQFDPWVGVGTGWRGYWVRNDNLPTHSLHGIDFVRAQVGLSYPIAPWLNLGPVVGASMTMFLSEKRSYQTDFANVDDPRLNTFVSAGIGGRFDIGGKRVTKEQQTAQR